MTENKRFTLTKGFDEHERQIRDNGKIIMGCFHEVQAKPIVVLLNELNDENNHIKQTITEAYKTERTQIGKNVLKQLLEQLE